MNALMAQYLSMVHVKDIKWNASIPNWEEVGQSDQLRLLKTTICHPVGISHTPSLKYRRCFLKFILKQLEQALVEICDELYELYAALLSENSENDLTCFKSYMMPDGDFVSLKESTKLISQGTTGLNTWQAALHLAEWVWENRSYFHNRNVLELGSGLGLTGLSVCKLCTPKEFIFSDCHAQVIYQLASNIKLNLDKEVTDPKLVTCSNDTGATCNRLTEDSEYSGKNDSMSEPDNTPAPSVPVDNYTDLPMAVEANNGISKDNLSASRSSSVLGHYDILIDSQGLTSPSINGLAPIDMCMLSGWRPDYSLESIPTFSDSSVPCVKVAQLDWEHVKDSDLLGLTSDVDIILAADVVYDLSIIPYLIRVLKVALLTPEPNSTHVTKTAIVASTIRNEDTSNAFKLQLELAKLNFSKLSSASQQHFYYDRSVPIEILQIQAIK